jgi:hypothetical protein
VRHSPVELDEGRKTLDSPILSVIIGLFFTFAVFAAVTSILTEWIARFLGLRGEYLLRGIRTMLDGEGKFSLNVLDPRNSPESKQPKQLLPASSAAWVTRVITHPLISPSGGMGFIPEKAGSARLTRRQRRQVPSYISARSFARAVIDLLVPDASGDTTIADIRRQVDSLTDAGFLRRPLLAMLTNAGTSVDAFRRQLETWYDDHMARVSGWYKQHVRWISFAVGVVLILTFNVNALAISRALYADQALRETVVAEAVRASSCSDTTTPGQCINDVRTEVAKDRTLGLPLGWQPVARCAAISDCSFAESYGVGDPDRNGLSDVVFLLTVLAGYVLMTASLIPGARFWFDLLSRLGSLRSSGPKPKAADGGP